MVPLIWLSSGAICGRGGRAEVRRDSFRGHFAAQSCNTEESGGTCELFVYLMKDLVSGEFYGTMYVRAHHVSFG